MCVRFLGKLVCWKAWWTHMVQKEGFILMNFGKSIDLYWLGVVRCELVLELIRYQAIAM